MRTSVATRSRFASFEEKRRPIRDVQSLAAGACERLMTQSIRSSPRRCGVVEESSRELPAAFRGRPGSSISEPSDEVPRGLRNAWHRSVTAITNGITIAL
jgi:hypothetical protein